MEQSTLQAPSGAPLFTKETAAQMGSKGGKVAQHRARLKREAFQAMLLEAKLNPPDATLEARQATVIADLNKCDEMIRECDDPSEYVKLIDAKQKLWKLLFPQPKATRHRSNFTPAEPV